MEGEFLEHFIDKLESRKLAVLKYIEDSYQQKVSILRIEKELNISSFVLASVVESLALDFETYDVTSYFQIKKSDTEIQLITNGEANSKLLMHIYIMESPAFKILDQIFHGTFVNVMDFAEANFLSRAGVYKWIKKLKEELRSHGIHLSSKFQLVGSEPKIRGYFFNMYYCLFNQMDYPFSKFLYKDARKLVRIVMENTPSPIAETMKTKLFYFFSIVLFRQKQKNKMCDNDLKPLALASKSQRANKMADAIKSFFTSKSIKPLESIDNEVTFIMAFIICENILSDVLPNFSSQPRTNYLTTKFIDEFQQHFPRKLTLEDQIKFQNELDIIHFKADYFEKVDSIFDEIVNVVFIQENYPEIVIFCEKFIENSKNVQKRQLIQANKKYLFNQYLFLIVTFLPVSFFMDEITVCIDFSNGLHYNRLISQNLKNLSNLNLKIEHHLTKKTDLLLTDYFIKKKSDSLNYLVWNAPPSPKDWANVANILIKIRNESDTIG